MEKLNRSSGPQGDNLARAFSSGACHDITATASSSHHIVSYRVHFCRQIYIFLVKFKLLQLVMSFNKGSRGYFFTFPALMSILQFFRTSSDFYNPSRDCTRGRF